MAVARRQFDPFGRTGPQGQGVGGVPPGRLPGVVLDSRRARLPRVESRVLATNVVQGSLPGSSEGNPFVE